MLVQGIHLKTLVINLFKEMINILPNGVELRRKFIQTMSGSYNVKVAYNSCSAPMKAYTVSSHPNTCLPRMISSICLRATCERKISFGDMMNGNKNISKYIIICFRISNTTGKIYLLFLEDINYLRFLFVGHNFQLQAVG